MTIESAKMGEQPIFTTKAHVFHIDPQTKRSWIPASSQAVSVNFFYDSSRNLYRIISVENAKAVVNSTITPNMTFTKTSQKFGQWSDIRANTVYGLGFSSEAELNKFIEKFQEVKEATRSAAQQKTQNGTSTTRTPTLTRGETINDESDSINLSSIPIQPTEESRGNLVSHQRSQSLSGLQASKLLAEAPKFYDSKSNVINQSSFEAQLKYENERLKLALAQSSTNAKKWEVELQTLKNNNTRLTNALQESTANVEEWKKQLQLLKDENNKMRIKTLELEASNGNPEAIAELRKEITNLSSRAETLEIEVRQKDKEIEQLKQKFDEHQHIYSTSQKVEDKLKALVNENENLKSQLNRLQDQSEGNKLNDKSKKGMFDQLNLRLAQNIVELKAIQKEFTNLLSI